MTETVVLDRWLCPTDIGLGFHDLKGGPIIDLVYNLTQKSLKRFEQLIMLIAEANICYQQESRRFLQSLSLQLHLPPFDPIMC